jgi:quinol-cytochrome oxidoreductase complex cytochrome b subunit
VSFLISLLSATIAYVAAINYPKPVPTPATSQEALLLALAVYMAATIISFAHKFVTHENTRQLRGRWFSKSLSVFLLSACTGACLGRIAFNIISQDGDTMMMSAAPVIGGAICLMIAAYYFFSLSYHAHCADIDNDSLPDLGMSD